MNKPKRLNKILISMFIVFIITSVVAVFAGIISTYSFKLVDTSSGNIIKESLEMGEASTEKLNILEKIKDTISVDDFSKLLSRDNMIALIVISILFGIAMNMSKEKAKPLYNILNSGVDILMNFLKIIMYYAPIGLGCYFASLVGTFGSEIVVGYFKTFIIYLITSIVFYFVIYTLYAYIAGGKEKVKLFYKNIFLPSITALATCSSAASIPVSVNSTKKMGVSGDIAETTIAIGTNCHKDGSIIGSVFKIMFLVYLFNDNMFTASKILQILGIALLATLLVTAVPIGGGTISEMMIITLLGYPVGVLPILTIIATIIDPPATVLNVVGNSSASLLVSRMVDKKSDSN